MNIHEICEGVYAVTCDISRDASGADDAGLPDDIEESEPGICQCIITPEKLLADSKLYAEQYINRGPPYGDTLDFMKFILNVTLTGNEQYTGKYEVVPPQEYPVTEKQFMFKYFQEWFCVKYNQQEDEEMCEGCGYIGGDINIDGYCYDCYCIMNESDDDY